MRRRWPRTVLLLFCALLATPGGALRAVAATSQGVQWQTDLEAAKTLAKQTNRLVLVHFWTTSCAPCVMLEQAVFNQAGVAAAIEQRFVPVKLNANENSATATGFGITRVPTDVILTPDGQVVGKLISPPTPAGYVAELNQIATAYATTPGQGFANAAANAPAPSNINAAYANLPLSTNAPPTTPFASAQSGIAQPPRESFQSPFSLSNSFAAPTNPASPPASGAITPIVSPQTAAAPVAPTIPATTATANASGFGAPPVPPMPSQIENRYAPAPAVSLPLATQQPSPVWPTPPQAQAPALITGNSSASLTMVPGVTQPPLPQQPASVAAQPTIGASPTDTRQLPPGAPPLGFDGYCSVSMRNNWKWVPGDPRWGIVHRGRTYWFASQAEQQQFWSDPDRYSPALSGMDPVLAIDHQQQVPGKREHSIDYDGLFYMFSSEATLAQFTANPERYAVGVRQAMGIPRGRLVR